MLHHVEGKTMWSTLKCVLNVLEMYMINCYSNPCLLYLLTYLLTYLFIYLLTYYQFFNDNDDIMTIISIINRLNSTGQ